MKNIKSFWTSLESNKKNPSDLKKINKINSDLFIKKIKSKNQLFIKKMIAGLYAGEVYIIKNAISKQYINKLKLNLVDYSKKNNSSFYKMLEKCPNYWIRQDEKLKKKYSFMAIRDSYYFFRWNKEDFKIWKNFDNIWGCIKLLGGLKHNEFKKNTPKNIVVDRVQVVRYPEMTGRTEPHVHDPIHQRLIISVYMSKMGKDFSSGGSYLFKKNKKINGETHIDIGDVGIFYATLKHGVDPVRIEKKIQIKNELTKGRWWCGLYSPESDYAVDRHTSSPIK